MTSIRLLIGQSSRICRSQLCWAWLDMLSVITILTVSCSQVQDQLIDQVGHMCFGKMPAKVILNISSIFRLKYYP